MSSIFVRPLLTALCTVFLCVGSGTVRAEDEAKILPVEENVEENVNAEDFAGTLFWGSPQADAPYLYRIHNDAYQHLFAFSNMGDTVTLHDGSLWDIHPAYGSTVLGWVQSDEIFVKPNTSWFSSYRYVLHNRTLDQTVYANLKPIPLNSNTLYIVNIEPYNRLVQLSDNTIWQVNFNDYNFPYWQIGQRVVVGVNSKWQTAPLPHILINADLYKESYSQADFYGYPVGYGY